jgi:hypothetical protein
VLDDSDGGQQRRNRLMKASQSFITNAAVLAFVLNVVVFCSEACTVLSPRGKRVLVRVGGRHMNNQSTTYPM